MAREPIRFLEGDAARKAAREESIVVRIFHPRGLYVRKTILSDEAFYWADDEIVLTATRAVLLPKWENDQPYTETAWLAEDELRFLSSILLCELEDEPRTAFYPVHLYARLLGGEGLSLSSKSAARQIRDAALFDLHRSANVGAVKAEELWACKTHRYSFLRLEQTDLSRRQLFFDLIRRDDKLLIRGISALMRADMLSRHPEFIEEAIILCFIALDASLSLVFRHLERTLKHRIARCDRATLGSGGVVDVHLQHVIRPYTHQKCVDINHMNSSQY